ncbi:uncharacterized protein G2W53_001337 [Senna tora]|uniref:Uncharacterized protein n=1 Tax=Senna tora TaxID=362788 RepID=A0A834XHP6_9FABA|nr:uncharacterized protein G2W53_001337 [Senna tora]
MEDIFANPIGIPSQLMCKIIGSLPAEDISKVPYVLYNWYLTCKKSSFINEHSSYSRLNNFRHMLFCVPDLDGGALLFFLQLHPLVDNERAVMTFSRIPSFLAQAVVTFVGSDEGVLCFHNSLHFDVTMRFGFAFDHKNREFCIPVICDSVDGDAPQGMENDEGAIFGKRISLGLYYRGQQIGRIDNSPALLRFLDFTGDYLIVITEKMQFYDDEEHNISQGLIFLESPDVGIIRRRKKIATKTVINIESSFEYSMPLNRDVFKRNKTSNVVGKDEDISHNSPLSESQLSTQCCSKHGGRSIEARLCSIERLAQWNDVDNLELKDNYECLKMASEKQHHETMTMLSKIYKHLNE